jgi:hypothetical protein
MCKVGKETRRYIARDRDDRNGERKVNTVKQMCRTTYEGSKGVAGCDPPKVCAKLALPPSCRDEFERPPPALRGTLPPPKAHPEPFPATFRRLVSHEGAKKHRRPFLDLQPYLSSRLVFGWILLALVVEGVAGRNLLVSRATTAVLALYTISPVSPTVP